MKYAEFNLLDINQMSEEDVDNFLVQKIQLDRLKTVVTQFTGIVILPGV
jgi:hypothetical protein